MTSIGGLNIPIQFTTSLHVHKVRVWCAVSACRIIVPVFFSEILSSYCYFWLILAPFLSKLTEEENVYSYFIQDCTLTDKADSSVAPLEDVFSIQIIICRLLPPRFPDMNVSDYYLWEISKGRSYLNSTHFFAKHYSERTLQNFKTKYPRCAEEYSQ